MAFGGMFSVCFHMMNWWYLILYVNGRLELDRIDVFGICFKLVVLAFFLIIVYASLLRLMLRIMEPARATSTFLFSLFQVAI